eukprot:TRINITY_DN46821_c0_g1_i1.p1 TRINITY_DN46821_c0_g1~~TRINITY_DN46821_c0_g1_i1.p1  ORF type:complete len:630 (+),score=210.07 TRINITY_DN46821_c0_g1_i1:60-1892(+)
MDPGARRSPAPRLPPPPRASPPRPSPGRRDPAGYDGHTLRGATSPRYGSGSRDRVREIGLVLDELRKVRCDLAADNTTLQQRLRERERSLSSRGPHSPPATSASPRVLSPVDRGHAPVHADAEQRLLFLERVNQSLQADNQSLSKSLNHLQQSMTSLRQAKVQDGAELERLNHELNRERLRHQQLEREVSELRCRVRSPSPRRLPRPGADAEMEQLQSELAIKRHENAGLRQMLGDERAANRRAAENDSSKAVATEQARAQEAEQRARDERELAEKRRAALVDSEQEASTLRRRVEELEQALSLEKAAVGVRDTQLSQLKSRIESQQRVAEQAGAQTELSDIRELLTARTAELHAAQEECARARAEAASIREAAAASAASAARPAEAVAVTSQREYEFERKQSQTRLCESVLRVAEHEAEASRLEEKIARLEEAQLLNAQQRDDAMTEAHSAKFRIAELEAEVRSLQEGVLPAAEARVSRQRRATNQAQMDADDARRDLADAEALMRKASATSVPVPTEHIDPRTARDFLVSWKIEAGRLAKKISSVRLVNRRLEAAVMTSHDRLLPPPPSRLLWWIATAMTILCICAVAANVDRAELCSWDLRQSVFCM